MRNMFQMALPLSKNKIMWCHLQQWKLAAGAISWRPHNLWLATAHGGNVIPCQQGTMRQGQTQLKHCSLPIAASKSTNRHFFSFHKKTAEEIKKADNVDSHYELVYGIRDGVTLVKLGIGGVNIIAATAIANIILFTFGIRLPYLNVVLEFPVESATFALVNLFICFQLFRIIRWCPLRIYYSEVEDHFLAVFIGAHPFSIRPLKIEPGEVKPLPPQNIISNVLSWTSDVYLTSSQKILLYQHNFKHPLYYNKLLGYV